MDSALVCSLIIEEEIVDELLDNLEKFESGSLDSLKQQISDEDYYESFVALSKQIAPDGKKIKIVGYTSTKDDKLKPVSLRKSRSDIKKQYESQIESSEHPTKSQPTIYSGRLKYANTSTTGKWGTVKLEDKSFEKDKIILVPKAIMKDVVQPYYGERVTVTCYMKSEKIYYTDIDRENDE